MQIEQDDEFIEFLENIANYSYSDLVHKIKKLSKDERVYQKIRKNKKAYRDEMEY